MLKPLYRPQELKLYVQRKRGGHPLQIVLIGVKTHRLDKELMAGLVREPHDLVLDGRTIPRSHSLDFSREERRTIKVGKNYFVRLRVGVAYVAGNSVFQLSLCFKGKWNYILISVLPLEDGKIYASPVHPRRRAGLETPERYSELSKTLGQSLCRKRRVRSAFIGFLSHIYPSAKICTGADYNRLAGVHSP